MSQFGVLRARYPGGIARVLGLRTLGYVVRGNGVALRRPIVALWIVVASSLLVWSLAIVLLDTDKWRLAKGFLVWILYFLGATVLMCVANHFLTQGFLKLTNALDLVLTQEGQTAYAVWAKRSLGLGRQLVFALIAAVVAPFSLFVAQSSTGSSSTVIVELPSYFVITIAGYFVGASAYWVAAGISLCGQLARRNRMTLYPLMPGRTPAIEEFAQLMTNAFVVCAVLSLVLLFPFIYWTHGVTLSISSELTAAEFDGVRFALVAVTAISTLALGVVPHVQFSRLIQSERRLTMTRLLSEIRPHQPQWLGKKTHERQELFAQVAESPSSTLGSGNIVQIAGACLAVLAPFALTLLFA